MYEWNTLKHQFIKQNKSGTIPVPPIYRAIYKAEQIHKAEQKWYNTCVHVIIEIIRSTTLSDFACTLHDKNKNNNNSALTCS